MSQQDGHLPLTAASLLDPVVAGGMGAREVGSYSIREQHRQERRCHMRRGLLRMLELLLCNLGTAALQSTPARRMAATKGVIRPAYFLPHRCAPHIQGLRQ